MKTKSIFSLGLAARLVPLFIFVASILVLPKVNAAINDTFTIGGLKYTVYTEEPADQTGTVSVKAQSTEISGDIVIPAFVSNHGISYSVSILPSLAFSGCTNLTGVVIGNNVKKIGGDAFTGCNRLINATIGNSVTEIDFQAFAWCSDLKSVTIPDSVTKINYNAFAWCGSLASIVIPDSVTFIGDYAFHEGHSLTSVTLSKNITEMGTHVFNSCVNLESVKIPDTFTFLPPYIFNNCISLANVTIPDSVTVIGDGVFAGCVKISSVTIPDRVTIIGGNAFAGCSMENIEIPDGVTSIGWGAFSGCSNLTSLEIPDSVTAIGGATFVGCDKLTSLDIPEGAPSIGDFTFSGCKSLTSVTIPESVTEIGYNAFYACSNLKSITIPSNVTFIGYCAFQYCSSLTSLIIPNKVTIIDGYAFQECYNLTSIKIGNSLTDIGNGAFQGCSGLTSLIFPSSVNVIGMKAFHGCTNLTAAYFKGNAPAADWVFNDPTTIYYRAGTTGWTNPWSWRPTAEWLEPPEITEQPQSHAVLESDSVTFSVVTEGPKPQSYQWCKEGVAIENAVHASYTIESVTGEDLGNYTVVVSNENGEATSDIAVLSYLTAPTITVHPVSLTVDAGAHIVFSVDAPGAVSYQWYKNDLPITGATDARYSIDPVKGISVGSYKVIASNRAGTATSMAATLTLAKPYSATATVQVINGFLVGMTVTDGGWGYTDEPKMRIKDETGSGAVGHCVIENGIITQIIMDDPGSNYSGEATVLIGSPLSNSSLEIGVAEVEVEMNLVLGMEYQLWSSTDCVNWTKEGEPFIAEEEEMAFFFNVEDYVRYFKLQEI